MIPRLSYNKDQKYAIFDLETEGLSLHLSRPWQLAFVIYQNGKIIDSQEHFIWWEDLNIPYRVQLLTHFDRQKYESLAKDPKEVCQLFQKYLYDPQYLIAGHNIIGYDSHVWRTLAKLCNMWRGWSFIDRMIDTLCLARMYHNGIKPDMNNFLASQMKEIGKPPRGSKKATLTAMAKEFQLEFDEKALHDAVKDVALNAQVLNKLSYALDI